MNWKPIAIVLSIAAVAIVGIVVARSDDATDSTPVTGAADGPEDPRADDRPGSTPGTTPGDRVPREPPSTSMPEEYSLRFLYSEQDILGFQASMTGEGPYFARGDAGHGGAFSPADGQRSLSLAREFLRDPEASYWVQPDLPLSSGDPWPAGMEHARPMHAAWAFMTQPERPDRETLRSEVRRLLLHHAQHPSHDFSDASKYPIDYPGYAPSPIFATAYWVSRHIRMRDMLGRDAFNDGENALLDRWFYDYANWSANWIQTQGVGRWLPGRTARDYTEIRFEEDASRSSYDGGPLIGSAGMAYHNRNAAVAATMSLATNYLFHFGYSAPPSGGPNYGTYTISDLLDHSRLFVEEALMFSVWPEGVQGDFERGDRSVHSGASPQTGWLYSANVLANLLSMAQYHAANGDMSVWNFGTTDGYDGSAGSPSVGGFEQKNLHFLAWAMIRYVNDDWQRTNGGERLALDDFYHDVIPAALASRLAPEDELLETAWKRAGNGFPEYPDSPVPQGTWPAYHGEGAKGIGLIEQAVASPLG